MRGGISSFYFELQTVQKDFIVPLAVLFLILSTGTSDIFI